MTVFQIGDAVETIDDTIKGIVVEVNGDEISIETDEGFSMLYAASELVKVTGSFKVSNYEIAQIKSEKEIPKKRKSNSVKPKERNTPKMEVDLHLHQITKSEKGMTAHDKLNLQLETVESVFKKLFLFME